MPVKPYWPKAVPPWMQLKPPWCPWKTALNFNAGYGACLTFEGHHELDAAIADGRTGESGAVANVRYRANPVKLARAVMEHTDHMLLGGEGAERFGDAMGFERVENSYFTTELRRHHWETLQEDRTMPCSSPTLSASVQSALSLWIVKVTWPAPPPLAVSPTSAGDALGIRPFHGAGNYAANDSCAISCTGKGEYFMKHATGHDLATRNALSQAAAERSHS